MSTLNYKQLYADGKWVKPFSSELIHVKNPYSTEIVASVPYAGVSDSDRALKSAHKASKAWAMTSLDERLNYLELALNNLKESADELADVITNELGAPVDWSKKVQVGGSIHIFEKFIELARNYQFEEVYADHIIYKEPFGVVLAICPWNYPLYQAVLKVVPALIAGNTVILKPSSETPLSAFYLADAFHKASLPAGVFNLLTGTGNSIGDNLVESKLVNFVSFTGSTEVGARIAGLAAKYIKNVSLELGGKSPCLILDDADLEIAAKTIMNSCFSNTGQTCSALTRVFVPRQLKNDLLVIIQRDIQKYKSQDPRAEGARVGTLISPQHKRTVLSYVDKAIEEGASIAVGVVDRDSDTLFDPVVLVNVNNDMLIAREEVFGPVLSIIDYDDVNDAINQCNDTDYGLSAAVMGSEERALEIARLIKSGNVIINANSRVFDAPFGGYKMSGIGRESGRYGLEEFLETKAVFINQNHIK